MSSIEKRTALIAGSTGLVGGHLLDALLAAALYDEVRALVRRPTSRRHAELRELVVEDFDRMERSAEDFDVDDVFCCLGTTIKKAGSEEAFRTVDLDYVEALARLARGRGARRFVMISSIGADADSKNFYLSVKGAAEDAVKRLDYPEVHILRPSLLLGDRDESRPGERAAILASKLVAPLMVGPVRRYRPVPAETVAAAMLGAAQKGGVGQHVHQGRALDRLAGR